MKFLRTLPLEKKLISIIALSSIAALVVTIIILLLYETTSFKSRVIKTVNGIAEIYSVTMPAALSFNDPKAALENLSALKSQKEISKACIYRIDGSIFVQYSRIPDNGNICPAFNSTQLNYKFDGSSLKYFYPIYFSGELTGIFFLQYNLPTLAERFFDYMSITVAIILTLLVGSFFIATELRKNISKPILNLTHIAQQISKHRNYNQRAISWGDGKDEIAILTEAFNQMLDTIQLSLSLQQATLEATADGILVVNKTQKIVSYNKKFLTMFRLSESSLENISHLKMTELFFDQIKNYDEYLKNTYNVYNDDSSKKLDLIEFTDGRIFERYSQPQRLEDKIVGRVWSYRDITIAKNNEETLKRSEARFRRLSDSNMLGIFFCDIGGKIYEANDYFLSLVGFDRTDLVEGKLNWAELTPEEYRDRDEKALKELNQTGVCEIYEKEYIRKDSKRIPILLAGAILEDSRNDLVAFMLDISALKKAEKERDKSLFQERQARLEAENALQLREDFISIAAHELRTPLTPLKIQNDAFKSFMKKHPEVPESEKLNQFLILADQQIKRLFHLVEELLDATRIRSGILTLNLEPFDLSKTITDLIDTYQETFTNKKIEVQLQLEKEIFVESDKLRIEQVMSNLINNAIKYGNGNPIHISLLRKDHHAELIVKDFGQGIDEEFIKKIFNRFERAFPVNSYGGFGLSLYITRKIVEAMHGEITIESQKNVGTTFIVKLPCISKERKNFNYI